MESRSHTILYGKEKANKCFKGYGLNKINIDQINIQGCADIKNKYIISATCPI